MDTYRYTSVSPDPAGNPNYPVSNLFDGEYRTCWVANQENGTGNPRLFIRMPDNASVLNKPNFFCIFLV